MDAQALTLYTFSISHFSEKIRWALERAGLPFDEVPLTPFFHIPRILALTRRSAHVPVLVGGGQVLGDSTRILEWLACRPAPFALMPASPALREEAMAIEARFDRVGAHVVRQAFAGALAQREEVLQLWTMDASPLQARALRAAYPLLRRGLARLLQITPANCSRSIAAIDEAAAWIGARTRDGRRYLAGEQFSVADLTAAALLAPLACPDEHPVFGSLRYRRAMRMSVVRWDDHPGFEWVRKTYARERLPAR
jgi:glutathione S-transferase